MWRVNNLPGTPQLVVANPGLAHPKVCAHADHTLLPFQIKRSHQEVLLCPEVEAIACKNEKLAAMTILYTSVLSFQHFIFHATLQLKHIQQTVGPSSFVLLFNKLTGLALHL